MDEIREVRRHLLGPRDLPDPLLVLQGSSRFTAEPDEAFPEILAEHGEDDKIKPGVRVAEHVHCVFDEMQVLEFTHVKNVQF